MSTHLEWIHAGLTLPSLMNEADVEEYADDGNDAMEVGVHLGDTDGAVLYGTPSQIHDYLIRAMHLVETQWLF